jgi:hypothetical protein
MTRLKENLAVLKEFDDAQPALKALAILLVQAARDKHACFSLSWQRGKRHLEVKYDQLYMVPPSRCLGTKMMVLIRKLGRLVARTPESSFEVQYTETKHERRCEVLLRYREGHDVATEVKDALHRLMNKEQAQRQTKQEKAASETRKIKRQALIIAFLMWLALFAILSVILVLFR